jgi:hypothetical protein
MSRPGRFASSFAALSAALLLVLHSGNRAVAEAAVPSGWQASGSAKQNPFREQAPSQWSRGRAHLTDAAAKRAETLPPSSHSLKSVQLEPTFSPPATKRRTAASSTPKADASRWLLPNQTNPKSTRSTERASAIETEPSGTPQLDQAAGTVKSHRSKASSASLPASRSRREPNTFLPPVNAARIASAAPPTRPVQPAHGRETVSPTATQASAGRRRTAPISTNSQMPHRHRAARGGQSAHPKQRSYAARLRNTINVAFEGPERWAAFQEAEDLPLPDGAGGPIIHEESRMMPRDGQIIYEDGYDGTGPMFSDGYGGDGVSYGEAGYGCGDTCEPGCGCGQPDDLFSVGYGDDQSCHTIRVRVPKWQELTLFGGAHGFKGPYDRMRDSGNFGFHEGINAGFKMPFSTMGYQIGYQAVHSQLHGDKDTDIGDPHTQQFVTLGLFQRVPDGFQWGVAWDMLNDERWGSVDFHQLRTELAFVDHGCHEVGLAGAFHLNEHELSFVDEEDEIEGTEFWQATDQYLLFYRYHGRRGGEGRVYAGFTDNDDGIFGADMLLPVHDRWSVETGFTYLIADDEAGHDGASNEAWNISVGLVWHYGCRARASHSSPYRPLFDVADNGSLIVDGRPGTVQAVNGAEIRNGF